MFVDDTMILDSGQKTQILRWKWQIDLSHFLKQKLKEVKYSYSTVRVSLNNKKEKYTIIISQ